MIGAPLSPSLGRGGFGFIPPAVPAIPVAWQLGGALVAGLKLGEGLAQLWGWLNSRAPATQAQPVDGELVLPSVGQPSAGGGTVRIRYLRRGVRSWGGPCFSPFTDGPFDSPGFGYGPGQTPTPTWTKTGPGDCGFDIIRFALTWGTNGYLAVEGNNGGYNPPGKVQALEVQVLYSDGVGDPVADPVLPTPAPERPKVPGVVAFVEPEVEPELEPEKPKPLAPPIAPPGEPTPALPTPATPVDPSKRPLAPPLPWQPGVPAVPATPTKPDGTLPPAKPAPVPVTPPDAHYPVPGAPPVTGNGPRPTPEGIAQELGRQEQKLARLLNPQDGLLNSKWDLFWKLVEFIMATQSGGQYVLREPCDPDGDGKFEERTVDFQGGYTTFGAILNRLDALAQLEQAAKDLRQPTCSIKPLLTGEWVSVRFQSDEVSPGGDTRLSKQFRYRDQTAAHQEVHVAHWEDFTWQAGSVCVISKGLSWGTPQVWAASADEGKRVISHAAAVAGVNLNNDRHEWIVTGSSDGRYGQPGTMRVQRRDGLICVSKRSSPSGRPLLASPGAP